MAPSTSVSAGAHSTPTGFASLPTYAAGKAIPGGSSKGVLGANGIRAWRHERSGVRIVLFAAPGPLVSATIVVGTEPISDAGHPHTLEHIIFLGSHAHPERGYLDNLACRCLADGTNAWTDNEYTAYTTTTAGFDGFAQLLPVFLDHIMCPKMNEAAFASEVYHVRADGKEAGVVFCEMQARENTEDDLAARALRGALLPDTPLALDSGGLCKEIRKLTNDDVVSFHRDQYCGANVTVVVGGSDIQAPDLLRCVQPLLDDLSSKPGYSRGSPRWQTPLYLKPLPPVTKSVVRFPCPDQDIGTVILGWRAPGAVDRETLVALDALLCYLAADVWSPLRQVLVETEDQLASDIYHNLDVFLHVTTVAMSFQGVHHLDEDEEEEGDEEVAEEEGMKVEDEADGDGEGDGAIGEDESFLMSGKFEQTVMNCLKDIVDRGELPGGLESIRATLKREKETFLVDLEADAHESVPYHLIEEIAYGENESLVIGEEVRGNLEFYASLEKKGEDFWIKLLRDILVEGPRVEITMVPDGKLADTIAEAETAAVAARVSSLGEEVLRNIGNENEARIASLKPGSFDADIFPPLPSTMNISRLPYKVSREENDFYTAQSVRLETDFVHCTIFLDTAQLSLHQRALLPLLCELIPSCDILLDDGSYVPYTDSARAISEATVSTGQSGVSLGYSNEMAHQCVVINFAAMPDSFAEATNLMLQTLFQSEVTTERLAAISQTSLSNSTADMRDGSSVLGSAVALLPYLESDGGWKGELPNFVLANIFGIHPLVSFLAEEFSKKKPRKQLQRRVLKRMFNSLTALRQLPSADVFIHIAARDPEPAHRTLAAMWAEKRSTFSLRNESVIVEAMAKARTDGLLPFSRRLCGTLSELLGGRSVGRLIGIAGVDSSSVDVRVDSPVFAGHAEWSAVTVLLEILCRMEGPLSNAVRGAGLAYGVYLSKSIWRGHLVLTIYESSSPAAAWDAICEALDKFRADLDRNSKESGLAVDLDTAKAATLYSLNRGRSTPEAIATGAISRSALGAPASPLADQALEEAVEGVTLSSLADVFDAHVSRLCKPENRMVTVTCGQGVAQETISAFKECSRPFHLEECSIESLFPKEIHDLVKSLKKG